jgi:hypothetical protein
MQKTYHAAMTRDALRDCFSPEAMETVVEANLGQDAVLKLLVGEYHFDGNRFEQAGVYVEAQKSAVIASLAAGQPVSARQAFGRLTHAVQDYYAHTNYVALWLAAHPGSGPGTGSLVNPVDPAILGSKELIAARVYYPWEALSLIRAFNPILERLMPPDSHARMNLDHPGRGPLFTLAISAATERTRLAFGEIAGRITGELDADRLAAFQVRSRNG